MSGNKSGKFNSDGIEYNISSEEIMEWLDNQSDFSLEMKTVSHLISKDFKVEHGGTYSDPISNRPRQFDIRCVK